jgi:NAD dependent epimerase/dehydratase family enzyme
MREFARALGRALRRPSLFPVPAFVLRLLLGEFANALLTGQRAMPKAAQTQGFAWKFPELEPALRSILTKPNRGNPGS